MTDLQISSQTSDLVTLAKRTASPPSRRSDARGDIRQGYDQTSQVLPPDDVLFAAAFGEFDVDLANSADAEAAASTVVMAFDYRVGRGAFEGWAISLRRVFMEFTRAAIKEALTGHERIETHFREHPPSAGQVRDFLQETQDRIFETRNQAMCLWAARELTKNTPFGPDSADTRSDFSRAYSRGDGAACVEIASQILELADA